MALVVVYIPPSGNHEKAVEEIAAVVCDLETSKSDGAVFILS